MKRKVDDKMNTYREWLPRGYRESYGKYKVINIEVQRMVMVAKMEASNRWDREFGRSFYNKKKLWKDSE